MPGRSHRPICDGSYTCGDVEKNFGVSAALLAEAFGVTAGNPSAFQVKSPEEMYAARPQEVGTASVRWFVALYLGRSFDLSTDTYLPESATALLRARLLSSDQAEYLDAHTITAATPLPEVSDDAAEQPPALAATPQAPPRPAESHAEPPDRMVWGKTTFAELLDWGVSNTAVEQVLGAPLSASMGMTVKDFCTE